MKHVGVTLRSPVKPVEELRPIDDTFMQKLGEDRETGETISNGYSEIYVNTEIDDGTDLAEYMQILKSSAICDNDKFPKICSLTDYYKNGKGRETMCKVVEEYAKDYAKEYAKEQAIETAKKLILSGIEDGVIISATKLTQEEVSKLKAEV